MVLKIHQQLFPQNSSRGLGPRIRRMKRTLIIHWESIINPAADNSIHSWTKKFQLLSRGLTENFCDCSLSIVSSIFHASQRRPRHPLVAFAHLSSPPRVLFVKALPPPALPPHPLLLRRPPHGHAAKHNRRDAPKEGGATPARALLSCRKPPLPEHDTTRIPRRWRAVDRRVGDCRGMFGRGRVVGESGL